MVVTVVIVFAAGPPHEKASWARGAGPVQAARALDFQAVDLQDRPFDGKSLSGKVVLLDFWADWCAPCIKAFPVLTKLQREYGEKGLQVVGVAAYSGDSKEVARFLQKHPVGYRVVVGDADLVERFGVVGFPTYLLLSREGRLAKTYVGDLKEVEPELTRDIEDLLQAPQNGSFPDGGGLK